MKYFFSTGEASGELAAIVLSRAIAQIDPHAQFEGIGGARMRGSGFDLWRDHSGWASLGPVAAIPRIPKLAAIGVRTAFHIARRAPDLVVLVDFGAFNVRLAQILRALGYRKPVLDLFPPATWLDDPKSARRVASVANALTAFEHQRNFYASLNLPIAYFGHPLAAQYRLRPRRSPPPSGGGTVALLPGSRAAEIRKHVPPIFGALRLLRRRRPSLSAVAGAANDRAASAIRAYAARTATQNVSIAIGTANAIADADAAWVASGTAVLECALTGVPSIALYIADATLARRVRKTYARRFVTLPNLVLDSPVVPEFLQECATAPALADAMDALLRDPKAQYDRFIELRERLGPPDALERCAAFAVELAKGGSA